MNRPPEVPGSEHDPRRCHYLALTLSLQVHCHHSPAYRRIGSKEEAREVGGVSTFGGHSDDGSGTRSGEMLERQSTLNL